MGMLTTDGAMLSMKGKVSSSKTDKRSRTITGCLCCRKRKKKCDESYPECIACQRNNLACVWPAGREEMMALTGLQRRVIRDLYRKDNQKILDQLDVIPKTKKGVVRACDMVFRDDQNVATEAHQDQQGRIFVLSSAKCQSFESGTRKSNKIVVKSPIVPKHFEIPKRERHTIDLDPVEQTIEEVVDSTDMKIPVVKQEKLDESESLLLQRLLPDVKLESVTLDFDFQQASMAMGGPDFPVTTPALDPFMDITFNKFQSWIPNVSLSTDDAFLYHLFVTEFMPLISPLHGHPLLSPGAICIPQVVYSPVLREIFVSCGAVYLGNKIPEFRDIARLKYHKSIRLLTETLKSFQSLGPEMFVSDWLLVAMVVFILLERSSGMPPTSYVRHLAGWLKIWSKRRQLQSILSPKPSLVTPLDRTLVEAFIFNYSVTILFCDYHVLARLLASPFEIFGTGFLPDLKKPIYDNCLVPWMNNPVVGSSLDSFIFALKLSWLCRLCLPLNKEDFERCVQLDSEIDSFPPIQLSPDLKSVPNYLLLENNISVAYVTLRLSKILVTKMLHPELTSLSPLIQAEVTLIIQELIKISSLSTECCLPCWAVLVAGSASINEEQLQFFKETNQHMAEVLNSSVLVQLNKFLTKVSQLNEQEQGRGFEYIFNTDLMNELIA